MLGPAAALSCQVEMRSRRPRRVPRSEAQGRPSSRHGARGVTGWHPRGTVLCPCPSALTPRVRGGHVQPGLRDQLDRGPSGFPPRAPGLACSREPGRPSCSNVTILYSLQVGTHRRSSFKFWPQESLRRASESSYENEWPTLGGQPPRLGMRLSLCSVGFRLFQRPPLGLSLWLTSP